MCDKDENLVPLFPNDKGNCAYVDMDRLVKETFSDEFMFKMLWLAIIGQEKDTTKREELLNQFVKACEQTRDKKE